MMELQQRVTGFLLGTAIGDALGLAREGLSRRRARRLCRSPPLAHTLLMGRGMCSDDTEHTVMVAHALLRSGGDTDTFRRDFAARLRWWLLRVPAGIGSGTFRACIKLWLGYSPDRSGVRSTGNGPAMRSARLGIMADTLERMTQWVHTSTQVTHRDSRAEQGARIIATATHQIAREEMGDRTSERILDDLIPLANDSKLHNNLVMAKEAIKQSKTPEQYANRLGLEHGVTGYTNHAVPAAIYCWLAHRRSFRNAVDSAVCLGGDSDTVAAMTGTLAGTEMGADGIPEELVNGIYEWPCSIDWLRSIGNVLATNVDTNQLSPTD